MSYVVPYQSRRSETNSCQKWKGNGDQLSNNVFQDGAHNDSLPGIFAEDSLTGALTKQCGGCVGTVVTHSAIHTGVDSINCKIDSLVEIVRRLEQSNQQLWQRFGGVCSDIGGPKIQTITKHPNFALPVTLPLHLPSPYAKTYKRDHELAIFGPSQESISKHFHSKECVEVTCSTSDPSTPIEKESVTLMPLVEGPASLSEDTVSTTPNYKRGLRSVSVGTSPSFENSQQVLMSPCRNEDYYYFRGAETQMSMVKGGENLFGSDLAVHKDSQCNNGKSTAASGVGSDLENNSTGQLSKHPTIDSQSKVVRKMPSQLFKRKLWNIESVSSSSSTGNPNTSCRIPYNTGKRRTPSAPSKTPAASGSQTAILRRDVRPQSLVENEVCQARAMILMVQEELVNTENSYVHLLSQFLILRDEIFAPGWRNDRQKFIRLFPAAVDDLCNLHRESFEAMRRAFDSSVNEVRPWKEGWTKEYLHQIPAYGEDVGVGEERRFACNVTPFTVLLEMLEGRRPLGCYAHSNCTSYYRNAPFWSTAPFFKLYARYLAEFSSAMHMLNKMRRGSSRLRKHLKQLQMHPACEFNDITTYLLAPVQRLPRYLLLVKKMIYYTRKLEPSDLSTAAKRSRPRVGLRRTVTPSSHFTTSPRLPHLDSLRRAEAALHGMLLELDEMIGSEVADFKTVGREVATIDGVKATPSYSNNCSDNIGENSSPNTLSFNTSMLTTTEEKVGTDGTHFVCVEKKNTEVGGFWKRLKSLRLTFMAKEANQEKFSGILDEVCAFSSPVTPRADTLPAPQPTPVGLGEGSRRSLSQSPRTQGTTVSQRARRLGIKETNSLEKTGEPQPMPWRRASSARPLSYSQPKKPTSLPSRRTAHQKQEHDTGKVVERKHSWRNLPHQKRPQMQKNYESSGKSIPTRECCTYSGEGTSKPTEPHSVPALTRPVKRNNRLVDVSDRHSTIVKSTGKSDSDSGINTQTDEERRLYRQSLFEKPTYSTARSRWQSRTQTPVRTTDSQKRWRTDVSRSASPTLSSSSVSCTSESSSTSYSLSNIGPSLRRRMSAALGEQSTDEHVEKPTAQDAPSPGHTQGSIKLGNWVGHQDAGVDENATGIEISTENRGDNDYEADTSGGTVKRDHQLVSPTEVCEEDMQTTMSPFELEPIIGRICLEDLEG